jgi:hypothetical protein
MAAMKGKGTILAIQSLLTSSRLYLKQA